MNNARHDSPHAISRPPLRFALSVCAVVLLSAASPLTEAHAQPHPTTQEHAPPIMKFIPNEERARLDAESNDIKKRVRTGLELADLRLERAAQLTAAERFDAAATEIGIYQALVEDTMRFLEARKEVKNGKVSNKFRDIYKRVELTLRSHGPRLETIRRTTPSEDAVHIRAAYDFTRQARADALNSFYGETVLRQSADEKATTTGAAKDDKNVPATTNAPVKPEQQ